MASMFCRGVKVICKTRPRIILVRVCWKAELLFRDRFPSMHSSCWRISAWSRAGTEVGLVAEYRTVVYKRAAIALNFFQFKTYQLALKVRVVGD
jgi:hypothetical protein